MANRRVPLRPKKPLRVHSSCALDESTKKKHLYNKNILFTRSRVRRGERTCRYMQKKVKNFPASWGFRATDAYYYFRYRKSVTVCEYIVHEVFFFIVKMTQEKFVDDGSVAQTKLFNRSTWQELSIDMNMHVYDAMFYIDMKRERDKRKFTCLTELFSFIYAENISQWCEICAYLIWLNKISRICMNVY